MATFTRINKPYIYGYQATIGQRFVEVVKAYRGEWLVFGYECGAMVRRDRPAHAHSYRVAMANAKRFLTGNDIEENYLD